jgi:copper chaperone
MKFSVPEMSCGHCTAAIETAITELDHAAEVSCDLGSREVKVSTALPQANIVAAIKTAGYSAELLAP